MFHIFQMEHPLLLLIIGFGYLMMSKTKLLKLLVQKFHMSLMFLLHIRKILLLDGIGSH